MHVHAAAVLAVHGLGHEGRVHAVVGRDLLDDQARDHHAVGHEQRLVVVRVDLVLRRGDLVVARLHRDAELVERAHRLLAQVVAEVGRQHVEVAAVVGELGGDGVLEVEVLELGADVEVEAHRLGALELAAEHPARVALEGLVVAVDHVAEDERGALAARGPGQHREGVPVGHRDDVALLDLGVAADGRAVEGSAALDHVGELPVGDLDHLEVPQDVREPQLNVLHVLVFDELLDGGLALICHSHPFRPSVWRRGAPYGRRRFCQVRRPEARRVRGRRRCSTCDRRGGRPLPARPRSAPAGGRRGAVDR